MKKLIILILAVLILCPALSACNTSSNVTSFLYDKAELYSVGGANLEVGDINKIKIDWIDGKVNVAYHSLDTVRISEKTETGKEEEDLTVHYLVDGNTLRIKFAASGEWVFKNVKKDLTVYLPVGFDLDQLEIKTKDSVVTLDEIAVTDLYVDTVSGSVMLDNCHVSRDIEIETVSGSIHIDTDNVESLKMETVSGSMNVTASVITVLDVETSSGQVNINASEYIGSIDIDAISSDVTLKLPETASFTLRYITQTGKMSCALPYKKEDGKYLINGGGSGYKISTLSGDVTVTKTS